MNVKHLQQLGDLGNLGLGGALQHRAQAGEVRAGVVAPACNVVSLLKSKEAEGVAALPR